MQHPTEPLAARDATTGWRCRRQRQDQAIVEPLVIPFVVVVRDELAHGRPEERVGHCQVDEKHVDQPPRYCALARREPTMLGIKNGRQPQLDNTSDLPHRARKVMMPHWTPQYEPPRVLERAR